MLTDMVDKPQAADINTGLSPLHQSTVMRIYGPPANKALEDDTPITNQKLKAKIVTRNVGPFSVTGHIEAVRALMRVFIKVKAKRPDLYAAVGTAGMLNARLVRGSKTSWSNHSWGFAVDLLINGKLDTRGDDKVMKGLLELYPFFRAEGFWWGAEFNTEDAMHFEVADETVLQWEKLGWL